MITIHQTKQGSDAWLEARKGKFTGSNAYKLLGNIGAAEYAKVVEHDFKGNFYTKRGHVLEEEAIELYEQIHGSHVDRPGYVTNSAYPNCLYSPDGIDGNTLLEVKCFNVEKHLQMFDGDIPLKILAQIHFGMLICGKRKARLVIYNPELSAEAAYKEIVIAHNRGIQNNFKRIIGAAHA